MEILRLKEILSEKGWSVQDFAKVTGLSYTYASEIVRNAKFPRKETLYNISQALDVDIRELFISTKAKDLSDPTTAINEIKSIIAQVDNS